MLAIFTTKPHLTWIRPSADFESDLFQVEPGSIVKTTALREINTWIG